MSQPVHTPPRGGKQTLESRLERALLLRERAYRQNAANLASIREFKAMLDGIRDNMRAVANHLGVVS